MRIRPFQIALSTKGDLLGRTSGDTVAVPVGPDGYILTADSSSASGVAWSPAAGGGSLPAWTAPTLLNSWVNFGSPYNPAGFYLFEGVVRLRGLVKSGTGTNSTIFTLPSGSRPANQLFLNTVSAGALGVVEIFTTGEVKATTYNSTYLSLDGITFRVA